jgi:translation elongation factor EF-G
VDHVEAFVVGSPLLDSGIRLMDLPGTNTSDVMDKRIAEWLEMVDLAVFVMDAGQGLTRTARNLSVAGLERKQPPILFVANKIDQCKPTWGTPKEVVEQKKAEMLATLYRKLRAHHAALRPCQDWSASPLFAAISAQNAGNQICEGKPLPEEFKAFRKKLFDLLKERMCWSID